MSFSGDFENISIDDGLQVAISQETPGEDLEIRVGQGILVGKKLWTANRKIDDMKKA